MSEEGERALLRERISVEEAAKAAKGESDVQQQLLTTLENAFQRIRQATGVTSLDEMVEKFLGQESSKVGEDNYMKESSLTDYVKVVSGRREK